MDNANLLKNTKLVDASLHDYSLALMRAESASLKEAALSEFFGDFENVVTESDIFSEYSHNKMQYVWKDFFKAKKIVLKKEVVFGHLGCQSPVYINIEISPDKFIKGYKDCVLFYEDKKNKYCVEIVQHDGQGGYLYLFHSTNKEFNFFQELKKLANEKNFYRGNKINCDCRFLKLDNVSWNDVILPKNIENVVKNNISDIFDNRELFKKYNILIKRGIILHGIPGTGKTQLCRCLAKDSTFSVLYALPCDFTTKPGGVRTICEMAKDLAPCLLIVEDLDWIAKDRSMGNAAFTMELMNQLDGLESFGDVITLATTNCIDDLEEAVKNRPGRFDRLIKIDKPDHDCSIRMVKSFTKNFVVDKEVNMDKLAKSLDGLTGAHIKDLCTTAAMFAVKASSVVGEKLLLKIHHFEEAIKEVRDKDYSSFLQIQNKSKNFGFSNETTTSIGSFLS